MGNSTILPISHLSISVPGWTKICKWMILDAGIIPLQNTLVEAFWIIQGQEGPRKGPINLTQSGHAMPSITGLGTGLKQRWMPNQRQKMDQMTGEMGSNGSHHRDIGTIYRIMYDLIKDKKKQK